MTQKNTYPNPWVGSPAFDSPLDEVAKTADYTVLQSDNGKRFTTQGAGGSVTFTLPALKRGIVLEFWCLANQNMVVTSAEGGNVVWDGSLANSTLTMSTSSHKIGCVLRYESSGDGTLWLVTYKGSPAESNVVAS